MAITYPLSLPAAPSSRGPARINIIMSDAVGVSASPFTFKQQVQLHDGSGFAVEVTVPPLTPAEAGPWIAFLAALRGRYGTFLAGDPSRATPQGAASGVPVVNGSNQTGSALVTKGWTAGVTGILKAGDHISISNHLYVVLEDADSDLSGEATLTLWPEIRQVGGYADNTTIVVSSPKQEFRLASNIRGYSVGTDHNIDVSFSGVEAR